MLNREPLRIAISGRSGCGNTTVSRSLAARLGLQFVNYTFRSIAEEDGISFEEVTKRAELSDEDDLRVDRIQMELARNAPMVVIGSRLAIWLFKEADLKVFLTGSPENRASRVLKREGGTLQNQMKITAARDKRDHDRYMRIYNIDNLDYNLADIIINTDRLNAEQVISIIERAALALVES